MSIYQCIAFELEAKFPIVHFSDVFVLFSFDTVFCNPHISKPEMLQKESHYIFIACLLEKYYLIVRQEKIYLFSLIILCNESSQCSVFLL